MASRLHGVVVACVLMLAADGVAAGDGFSDPSAGYPNAFGVGFQWTVIHASQWQPRSGSNPGYILGMIFPAGTGQTTFWTQVELPLGAEIHQVCFDVFDGDFTGRWSSLALFGYEAGGEGYTNAAIVIGYAQTVTGWTEGDGYQSPCVTLSQPVIVRSWGNLGGASTPHRIAYGLLAVADNDEPGETMWLNLWGAAIKWKRLISPAPLIATFGDVPLSAFGFQHVESLAASGITAGCGGGNFCPDREITRVEMAIFLAKALGLHWGY